ncbi:ABC transporter permease [Propylenella binzhouense]|uniref:ABC transporter permease n=1 Tax=Propylenella binzhouense TaxID=2555902 RepID=A0A964T522_9HYPH|nr:ABC transporter permease [Propylenella binzhouense]MYZ48598.1 ABC transporter permease [Propylenella binzhouense]
MTSAPVAEPGAAIGYRARAGWPRRLAAGQAVPVLVVCLGILAIWYVAAVALNAPFQRDAFARAKASPTTLEFVAATLAQDRPVLPSPHQVAEELWKTTVTVRPSSKRSLVYHGWVTLSSTLLGFLMGTLLGVALAVAILHSRTLDKSLMPWIVASQTIPILAIAPMVIVVLNAVGITGLVPKAAISTYLSFFPVTVGMVKGLRSPEPIHLDLMRTYSASRAQLFWKLRWPASVPFLFTSMKVAVAASLVGAIVGEMPTGAVAGLGARLLSGSYYGQTVQIWAALLAAALLASVLVAIVGLADRIVRRRMGAPA